MSTMKFCSRQSSNGTMRSMKILTSSQASNDHDELAQSLSHHLTCQARLTMPVKASELDETCSLRLEQPHNPTMAAGNHRKINSQIPVLLLSGLDSSKTTNSLTRAIITKQYDNEKKKISSSMKCPNQDHNNNNRPKRQVYALRSTLFKTQRLTLVDRASSSAKLSPLNYLIVTLALSSCLFITHIGAFEGPSASLGETSSAVDQASAKRDQAQDGAANKAAIERSDSSAGSSVLKSLESSPAATASSSPSASSSSQKSIVASLSSAVATAAAAAAVAAAQNGLSNNDARSLTTSGSRRQNAQGNTHRSPGLNLAIKLVDTIPEVPYNILHNMKKVEHAAPFYNQPNKFSNGAPKESTQNFLANALTATGASEQLAVLFKSPLWKRIADGYGDFASEFRSLFHAPGAKPMKGPSSATSKLLRDISVPALLMLIASSISGEWRPVRTRRKSFRPVDIPAGSSLHQKSPQLSGSLASILADPSTSSSSSSSSSSSPSSLAAPADAVEQQQPASVAAQYFQRYEQSQRPQFDRPFVDSQAQPAVGGGYWPMPVQNNDWLHQIQQQQAGLAFGQQMSQVGQQQPQQQSSVRDEVNLRGSELFPTNWIAPDQHQASSSLVDGNLKSFISPNGNDQQQSAFDLQPSATTLGQQQQAVMVRRSGDMIITDGQHQFVGEGGQLASSPAIDSPSSSFPIASNPISPAFAYNHGSKLIAKLLNVANDGHSYRMMSDPLADHNVNDGMSSIKRGDQLNDNQMYSLIASPDEISANSAPASVASLQPAENGGVHELLSAKESSTRRERKEQQQQHRQPLLLSAMAQTMASMLGSRSATGSGRSGSQSSSSGIGAAAAVSPLASLFNAANSNKQNFMTTTGGDKTIINEQHRSNNHNQVLMRRQQQSAEQRDLTKLLPETWREVVKRTMTTVQQQANTQWKSIEGQLANWVQDKLKTVAASATSNSPNQATSGGSSGGSSPVGSVPAPIGNMLASVSSTALNILGLHKNNHNNSSHSPNQAGSSSSSLHTANSVSQASEQPGATSASNQRGKVELMKAALNQQQQQPANSKGTLAGVANLIVSTISNRNSPKQSSSPLSTSSSTHHNNQSSQSQPITTTTTNNEKLKSQPLGEIAASVASVALTNFASKYPTLTGNNASPHSSPQVPTSQSASPLKPASTTTTTSTTTSSTTTTAPTS